MSRPGHISSTLAFIVAFAIAPLFLQHCVMAEAVIPRIFQCEDERPVEPCHDDEAEVYVELCCAGVDAALHADAVVLNRAELPALIGVGALFVSAPSLDRDVTAPNGRLRTLPPPAPRERLSVVLCTFLC